MSAPAKIVLELTPNEFDVLTWLFSFGGYVASCEPGDSEMLETVADMQRRFSRLPAEVECAEGTLNRKIITAERQRGVIPKDKMDEIVRRFEDVGGAWSGA